VVSRLAQFGAFVTLAEGIDGLIHISKLGAGRRINHPREVTEVGQNIEVTVVDLDPREKRISLAPADYVSAEKKEEAEKADYAHFVAREKKQQPAKDTGSLGALLKAKMAEKKK
jgi:small subunit ribosomal protein S1